MTRVLPLPGDSTSREPTVIVSGLPRSGTSMMMQIIEAGGIPALSDGVREADSDNPRGYLEFEPVKRTKQDPSWLDRANGRVVKMVHVLLQDLPTDRPYRVIMMRRKLEAVIKSQTVMLERLGEEGASLPPEKLARVYERQMEDALVMMARQPCFAVLQVWYGMIIEHTESEIKRINAFLSGEMDTQAMIRAVDPSLRRQKA